MRKLIAVTSLAVLVGCGGSSNSNKEGPVTGTIGGKAFTPASQVAVVTPSVPCTPIQAQGLAALGINLTSYANGCGDFAKPFCAGHMNAQSVTIIFASINGAGAGNIVPGTYSVSPSLAVTLPDPKQTGLLYVAWAGAVNSDGSCVPVAPTPGAARGTLRLDKVDGPVTGFIDVTFQDSGGAQIGTFKGDFSATVCGGINLDVCGIATSPNPGQCANPADLTCT